MKLGMNLLLWTDHPKAEAHSGLFERIRGWGFDGVELPIDALKGNEVKELSRVLNQLGLERTAISALDAKAADPSSPELRLRRAAVDSLKRSIEHASDLDISLLCGPLFQGLGKFTGKSVQSDEWKYAVDTIREVGEFAKAFPIKLALEPLNRFEMYLVNTVADGVRFVEDVGLPNVGLLVDTHHGNIEENNTAMAWEKAADHIFHVHISENNRGVPGSGQAISPDIFAVLHRIGYEGWMTIEAFGQTVPGLIPRLHLWRAYSEHNDDAARLGIEFIKRWSGSCLK